MWSELCDKITLHKAEYTPAPGPIEMSGHQILTALGYTLAAEPDDDLAIYVMDAGHGLNKVLVIDGQNLGVSTYYEARQADDIRYKYGTPAGEHGPSLVLPELQAAVSLLKEYITIEEDFEQNG